MKTLPNLSGVFSRVAGVVSGPDASKRQAALSEIRGLKEKGASVVLNLQREEDNKFDPNAVAVWATLPSGPVQLGYVRNADTYCSFCNANMEAYPQDGACKSCGRTDSLKREGLATRMVESFEKNPDVRYLGEVTEVTGGEGKKANFGCNYVIRAKYE